MQQLSDQELVLGEGPAGELSTCKWEFYIKVLQFVEDINTKSV